MKKREIWSRQQPGKSMVCCQSLCYTMLDPIFLFLLGNAGTLKRRRKAVRVALTYLDICILRES